MKNVATMRHKFAKGDKVIIKSGALRGLRGIVAKVHFCVAYEVKIDGDIEKDYQEDELKRLTGAG